MESIVTDFESENMDYTFKELFVMGDIQEFQDALSEALQVGIIIVSPDGTPITNASNFCSFCKNVVRSSEKGRKKCAYSDSVLGRPNMKGAIISKCLSAGLLDAGISIVINGKHIASFLLGQVMIETLQVDDEENRKKAIELDVDPDAYCREIKKVPVMTRERFESIVEMCRLVVVQISELGIKNLCQKRELIYRKKLEAQLQQDREKLLYLNTHDILTGLYSRAYFEEKILEMETNGALPITVVSGDMNNLKLMNDVFGHEYGDILIKTIAEILQEKAKEHYIISRCGGDEINILMPNTTISEAEEYCEKVRKACSDYKESVLPIAIALGAKEVMPNETIRGDLNVAESLMYIDKAQIKAKQDIFNDIERIMIEKGYSSELSIKKIRDMLWNFGKYLGLGLQDIEELLLAAKIQDFGMLAVPRLALIRNAKTKDESDKIKKHPEIGYRFARIYDETFPLSNIILQAHETWDGKGYPNKLAGKNILYFSRIMSMVTTFVYWITPLYVGSGLPYETALERLKKERGNRFDPDLVDKFIDYINTEYKHN